MKLLFSACAIVLACAHARESSMNQLLQMGEEAEFGGRLKKHFRKVAGKVKKAAKKATKKVKKVVHGAKKTANKVAKKAKHGAKKATK